MKQTILVLLAVLLLSADSSAQDVPMIRLTSAPARLDDGFSWIRSIRELADGRVLASVSPKPSFVVVDFSSGSIEEVSREGSGPGEYRGEVGRLRALGGDSTLALDEKQKLAAIARDWTRSPTLFKPDEYPPWPGFLPPFQEHALVAMADGRLAIQRTPDANVDFIVYDLVDRAGRLTARLQLRKNQELKAITGRYAYVQRRDSDDLIWLERFAWLPG